MNTLVIGGTLFIGREIVRQLAQRGHSVTVLHRRDRHDLGPDIGNVKADRADLAAVTRILRDGRYDAIFDVAYDWEKGTTPNQVEGAARACGNGLQRYVFVSSVAAYVPGTNLRESAPLVPDDFPNPYAQHKASSERALFRMHAESGLPVTTFRPPFVHGPRQPFYREQFFWDRMRDGRPIILPDGGDAPMQWVFVSDLAQACVRAIEVPEATGEAFNIAHLEPLCERINRKMSPQSEPALAISKQNGHNIKSGAIDCQIHVAVLVEIAGHDQLWCYYFAGSMVCPR